MKQNETFLVPKSSGLFECKLCHYYSSRKSQYERHLLTAKHILKQTETDFEPFSTQKTYNCKCGQSFNSRTSLWRHSKKYCINKVQPCFNKDDLNNENEQQKLIDYLLKENSEFKQLMIDQNKQMIEQNKNMFEVTKTIGNNNNNTTNNNNSFNLNFFLNETCKNAMNIMDFVSQLQVGIKDLEETGRLGFAEGISKIFINGLKQIDVSDRPIHCSDFKRETLYIKNNNEWNKESEDKAVLTNAIKHVAHKNIKQISEWTKYHPEYNDSDSKQNDKYLKIVSESMSGSTKEETNKNYTKIIKNIVKETVIDK
jgi:hypothetical protein